MPNTSQEAPKQNRQAQGLACNECRARKLRCDRVRPTCGTCKGLSVACTPNTSRQPRGPRRGHLKVLQSRILALERQLGTEAEASPPSSPHSSEHHQPDDDDEANQNEREHGQEHEHESQERIGAEEPPASPLMVQSDIPAEQEELSVALQDLQSVTFSSPFPTVSSTTAAMLDHLGPIPLLPGMVIPGDMSTDTSTDFNPNVFMFSSSSINGFGSSVQSSAPLSSRSGSMYTPFEMSDLMKNDLNHLYFDRIHLFAPILNSRRYFARAAQPSAATAPFVALQHAVWTLATWLGSQFKEVQKSLYDHTRMLLEEWEPDANAKSPPIELAQAWILLATYEIMQINYERGWLSAGRCFRLVQLMKLHEIDMPDKTTELDLSPVEAEERRRTFWMAYSLDRFINLVNQMPLTLNEQILTRLPAPEADFNREKPVKTCFLSEVIAGGGNYVRQLSPFNACVVLVTISGRCLSHQQQCTVEKAYGNMPQDFLTRHQWLESLLASITKSMLTAPAGDPQDEPSDPMLLFTHMVACATTLLLSKAMQYVPWNCRELAGGHEQRGVEAARRISHLYPKLVEFGHFKIHPFTPIPLFFCADFAQKRKRHDASFQDLYDLMISSLRDLSAVNLFAETCLARFVPSDSEMSGTGTECHS